MKAILILLAVILVSCDETKDFISSLNEAPQINFTNNPDVPVLTDSIKLGLKYSQEKYVILLSITDRNKNIREVVYTQLAGTGKLKQDGIDIVTNKIEFKKDVDVLTFDYYPGSYGEHRLSLRVTDNFNLSNTVMLKMIAFENLLPVARATWTKRGERGRYHYEIRATESFDRDEHFGGQIVEYEYKAQGVIHSILATTDNADRYQVIFEGKGIYPIEVRVRDNDGKWSAVFAREIVVD